MRLLTTVAAAAGILTFTLPATPALAVVDGNGCITIYGTTWCPETPDPECECVPDALDVLQRLNAAQTATNRIDDFKTVENVVQTATNIGNSVSIEDLGDDLPDMSSMTQIASGYQKAWNYIEFGGGGYNGPEYVLGEDGQLDIDHTQSALNAVNLINVPSLGAPVYQENTTYQEAINTATFEGHTWGWGWSGDVDDLTQSATNVANSISAAGFFTFEECECIEIEQISNSTQLASNTISGATSWGLGSLNEAVQNATNVANSISGSLPEE